MLRLLSLLDRVAPDALSATTSTSFVSSVAALSVNALLASNLNFS